ncbi:30S ribosomal protein S20 [Texas Phoenix palm phytoplasma]|uniref:Small ribosomal subunit protein bS20 n=1 Tax=Texas Phoenix palm phytoplasma TaxID=176709 RepID=A0ABS5BIP5_9MOLU|nr:30S ribosomal protein S20 [Texas Phoenix palm phytoplasma]MBP3059216.1 30S ribosomal protein S20 [Texas Phoenix palm phytoplasma]
MANIKKQKKRNKTNEKRRLKNASFKSSIKTVVKKFKKSIISGSKEESFSYLNIINKKLDKSLSKGIYHSNFVSRNKSNLTKLFNNMDQFKN